VEQLQKHVSYLAGHGLVGTFMPEMLCFSDQRSDWEFYLTASGENFMRELDEMLGRELQAGPDVGPGVGQRVTLKIADFVYDTGKAVIVNVLTNWMVGGH